MRCNDAIAIALGILAVAATPFAQKKPDFSGRWTVTSPAEAVGQEQVIKQDAKTLTTEVALLDGSGVFVLTYNLDGAESRMVWKTHGQDAVTLGKASWAGDRLTITRTTTYPDGRRLDQKEVLALDGEGRLVREVTDTMQGKTTKYTMVHRKR